MLKRCGQAVLADANLSIGEGVTALLGRNGAGKTTLIRALTGFLKPSAGEILLDGRPLSTYSDRERAQKLAYVPQNPREGLFVTAAYFVAMGAFPNQSLFRTPGPARMRQAGEILFAMGLSQFAERGMDTLSGGETRLMYLARAQMQGAECFILDEPLAGLDYAWQHRFLERLKREKRGVFLSLHDPSFAMQYADRIVLIADGRLYENPREANLQAAYGRELRLIEAENQKIAVWKGSST